MGRETEPEGRKELHMGGGGSGGMSEYYQAQQLELAKTSVLEPTKSAAGNMKGASSDAAQRAALRRGIASTFNRPSAFSEAGASGATSGGSSKLGN